MKLGYNSNYNINLLRVLVQKLYSTQKILRELTFCQAILEGGLEHSPPSTLAAQYCNLFGMKPGALIPQGTASPGIIRLTTRENSIQDDGSVLTHTVIQPFLANNSIEDSLSQHMKLLTSLPRYANLLKAGTFVEAANLIYQDGYATDPRYPVKLKAVYDQYAEGV